MLNSLRSTTTGQREADKKEDTGTFWYLVKATIRMGAIRRSKTKRRTRDLDQIRADLESSKHLAQYKLTKATEDLPGLGEYYCVECSKWFEGEHNLVAHRKGKNHKRRIRMLREEPHTQKAAEAAVGLGTDNGKCCEKTQDDTTAMEITESN